MFFSDLGLFLFVFGFGLEHFVKLIPKHTGHKYRREETRDDADNKRQREIADGIDAEYPDHTDGEQGGDRGVYASAERFVYAGVDDFTEIGAFVVFGPILSYTVKYDYRSVDRITEYGKERRDDVGVDRDLEE